MGRKKGSKKTGGRKKGVPNKVTQTFRETLTIKGFDVAAEAVDLYRSTNLPLDLKFKLLSMIADYSTPKPKPAEEPSAPPAPTDPEIEAIDDDQLDQELEEAQAAQKAQPQ